MFRVKHVAPDVDVAAGVHGAQDADAGADVCCENLAGCRMHILAGFIPVQHADFIVRHEISFGPPCHVHPRRLVAEQFHGLWFGKADHHLVVVDRYRVVVGDAQACAVRQTRADGGRFVPDFEASPPRDRAHPGVDDPVEIFPLDECLPVFLTDFQRCAAAADEVHEAGFLHLRVFPFERAGLSIPASEIYLHLVVLQRVENHVVHGPVLRFFCAEAGVVEFVAFFVEDRNPGRSFEALGPDHHRNVVLAEGVDGHWLLDAGISACRVGGFDAAAGFGHDGFIVKLPLRQIRKILEFHGGIRGEDGGPVFHHIERPAHRQPLGEIWVVRKKAFRVADGENARDDLEVIGGGGLFDAVDVLKIVLPHVAETPEFRIGEHDPGVAGPGSAGHDRLERIHVFVNREVGGIVDQLLAEIRRLSQGGDGKKE